MQADGGVDAVLLGVRVRLAVVGDDGVDVLGGSGAAPQRGAVVGGGGGPDGELQPQRKRAGDAVVVRRDVGDALAVGPDLDLAERVGDGVGATHGNHLDGVDDVALAAGGARQVSLEPGGAKGVADGDGLAGRVAQVRLATVRLELLDGGQDVGDGLGAEAG